MWTENVSLILYEQFVVTFHFCFILERVNTFFSRTRSINMYSIARSAKATITSFSDELFLFNARAK